MDAAMTRWLEGARWPSRRSKKRACGVGSRSGMVKKICKPEKMAQVWGQGATATLEEFNGNSSFRNPLEWLPMGGVCVSLCEPVRRWPMKEEMAMCRPRRADLYGKRTNKSPAESNKARQIDSRWSTGVASAFVACPSKPRTRRRFRFESALRGKNGVVVLAESGDGSVETGGERRRDGHAPCLEVHG